METKSTQLLLFCSLFLGLGFVLGRVTAPQQGVHGSEAMHWVSDEADVEVMLLEDEHFEGDTVFALPGGGNVHIKRNGGDMEVEVDIEQEGGSGDKVIRKRVHQASDGEMMIEKKIVVVTDKQ